MISRNTVCNFKPNGSIFKNASISGSAFLFQASMHNLRFAQFQSKDIIVSYREGVILINKMLFRSQHHRSAWLLFTWNYTCSAWNSHLNIEIKLSQTGCRVGVYVFGKPQAFLLPETNHYFKKIPTLIDPNELMHRSNSPCWWNRKQEQSEKGATIYEHSPSICSEDHQVEHLI